MVESLSQDFNSIYVFLIKRAEGRREVCFQEERKGFLTRIKRMRQLCH